MQNIGWIDKAEYPFQPHFLDLDMGKMHYVDEGEGSPIVMVHGTPTWSFLYRHLVKALSPSYSCVAPDNIGFGLSDKPERWSYLPEAHASNLSTLIRSLGLKDITLLVHDFGGPIGLSYAIEEPQNVARLIVLNTWMWSTKGNPRYVLASLVLGSPVGKVLYQNFNLSVRVVMKLLGRSKLPKHVHQHYLNALPTPRDRRGTWVFAKQLTGSSDWYDSLWQRRDRIKDKPALVAWGMKDTAFGKADLERWMELLTKAQVVRFKDAGHFVQEDKATELCSIVQQFLNGSR